MSPFLIMELQQIVSIFLFSRIYNVFCFGITHMLSQSMSSVRSVPSQLNQASSKFINVITIYKINIVLLCITTYKIIVSFSKLQNIFHYFFAFWNHHWHHLWWLWETPLSIVNFLDSICMSGTQFEKCISIIGLWSVISNL